MPKIVIERWTARLVTDDGRLIAVTENVEEEGMFLVFLTVNGSYLPGHKIVDREMVAACKHAAYVPAVMRGVLEGWFGKAGTQQLIDRKILKLPQLLRLRARA